jgi:sulfite reductase alpha subunit-like flavoprotein
VAPRNSWEETSESPAYFDRSLSDNICMVRKASADEKVSKNKKEDQKSKTYYPRGNLSIFFGSQTGTAEGFARIVMEEAKKQGYDARTVDLEDFTPEKLADAKFAVFLMATYGEGEPTDNAAAFYKWMKNEDGSASAEYLSTLKYCVFGLGNRQYEHFNRMGKFTDEHLEKFGARRVMPVGLGDDDGSLEDDFEKWREMLWAKLVPSTAIVSSQNSIREEKQVSVAFQVVKYKRDNPSTKQYNVNSLSKPLFQCLPVSFTPPLSLVCRDAHHVMTSI